MVALAPSRQLRTSTARALLCTRGWDLGGCTRSATSPGRWRRSKRAARCSDWPGPSSASGDCA
eukprot:4219777-Alexandrium_andersonii.AAC.1